jgi:hypothetical protein
MGEQEKPKKEDTEKISALNEIFEDVISDAKDLIKDLSWSVKTYLLFGLIMILFGISEVAYNAEVLQERYYLPLFIAGILIFAGLAQIYNYLRLSKKYKRLFGIQDQLERA